MALRLERASESGRWKHKLLVPPPELGISGLAGDPRACVSPRLPGEPGAGGLGPPLRRAGSREGRGQRPSCCRSWASSESSLSLPFTASYYSPSNPGTRHLTERGIGEDLPVKNLKRKQHTLVLNDSKFFRSSSTAQRLSKSLKLS